jgi:LytS/YehU family sensor histidine kinase
MRYMLYEVADKQVDLEKEVEMINNYLDLQKLRADDSTDIKFEIEGDPKGKTIAPLLFFPLIENSFKHGVKGVSDSAFAHMKLICTATQIEFQISNNKGVVDDMELGEYGGIGLQNVKSRLELIYPKKYALKVEDTEEVFSVILKLKS